MNGSMHKQEQVKRLANGKGIQYLLNQGYKIMGNPILVHDMEYNFVACTEHVVIDDPLWNEIVTSGHFSDESIEFFMQECFIDFVANTKTIALLTSKKLTYDRISGKIKNRDSITVASAILLSCERPLEDDDFPVFEAFCAKLSKEIRKIEFYQAYGRAYQDRMIRLLLEGNIEKKGLYSGHVANIDEGLKANLYVAVVNVTQCDPAYVRLSFFADLFKHAQPAFKYCIYSNYIVIIFSSDEDTFHAKKVLKKIGGICEQNNIYVGTSRCFDNLFELHQYFRQAVNALDCGRKIGGTQRIFSYGETGHSLI